MRKSIKTIKKKNNATYVKLLRDGDVGKVYMKVGHRIVVNFKLRGNFAISETLEGSDWIKSTESEYNKLNQEDVQMAKAKATEGSEKKASTKKDVVSKEDMDDFKKPLREKLNKFEEKKLASIAKKLNLDPTKYDHLAGGLKKMSLVNSVLGAIGKKFRKSEITKKAIAELLK